MLGPSQNYFCDMGDLLSAQEVIKLSCNGSSFSRPKEFLPSYNSERLKQARAVAKQNKALLLGELGIKLLCSL